MEHRRIHTFLIVVALPLAMVMPERFLSLGGVFLRWDYLLLLPAALIWLYSYAFKVGITENNYRMSRMEIFIIVMLIVFGLFVLLRIPEVNADVGEAIKYAIWPWKMLIWAMLVRELLVRTLNWDRDLLRSMLFLVMLIFSIQLLELSSSAFRFVLLDLYPISSIDRVQEFSYRARAIFNGYDVASIFYCGMGIIFFLALKRGARIVPFWLQLGIGMSVVGAFLAARTGFLLLCLYFLWCLVSRLSRSRKALLLVALIALGVVAHFMPDTAWSEGSLFGRYFEVLKIFKRGNPLDVQSFYGTLYMNSSLFFFNHWEPWFGAGLDVKTTADQLYAKYLFMLGTVGLTFWLLIHSVMAWVLAHASRDVRWPLATRTYARSMFHIVLLVFLAHLKGGNYFFAQRLGEYWFLLIFVVLSMRPLQSVRVDADARF